jgi:hypothetical protein
MITWEFFFDLIKYAGGSVAIAYLLFTWLGKRVVENWFSKRMEVYKNAQARELEGHKYKINALFNRVTKIHEKEFDVLPKAWEKLQDALSQVSHMASPLQSYPDFAWMSETEFHEFLENTKLRKHEIEKLEYFSPADRNKYYQDRIFWHELYDSRSRINDLHNFLLYNKIFLSKDLFDEFGKIDKMLFDAVLGIETNHESREPKLNRQIWNQLNTDMQEIAANIENLVQVRLHYPEA